MGALSEFSSAVELAVSPDPRTLRATRTEIEEAVGDIQVDVTGDVQGASSQIGAGGGGRRLAGRERAMSRQLMGDQIDRLGTVSEHLEYGVELDETRNDLLRELINETESGNFTRAKMGGLGMLGGALGLAGAGLAIGPAIADRVGDAISNIDIGGSIGEITGDVDASKLVAGTVGVSTLISGTVAPASLITGTIAASALITGSIPASALITGDVSPGSFIGSISARSIIDTVGASAILQAASAAAVLNPASATAVLTSVGVGQLIDGTIHPSEFVEGTISAGDLVDISGGEIDLGSLLLGGGAAAGSAAIASRIVQRGGPAAAAASSGVAAPVLTPEMFPEDSPFRTNPITGKEVEPSILTAEGRHDRLGGFGQWLNRQLGTPFNQSQDVGARGSADRSDTARERADRRGGDAVTVQQDIQVGRRSDREIERLVDRRLKEFRRQLEQDFETL